ncbi:cache domain-containing sensor histidine kinase [Paenibacillus piri]|uniref:Sensor histidine kinase n=1 Tax=Paenibacillus piri TaxID=2547395 RepID=A0A4R5KUT5_9BACL|nr:sensor histidine kinase [Paenibacillus piri]TDF98888.1 sensor histidine kinase [Paenibacillus piri]
MNKELRVWFPGHVAFCLKEVPTLKNPIKKYRIDSILSGSFTGFFILLLVIVCWVSYTVSSKELAENTSVYQQELMSELNKQMMLQMRTVEQLSLVISRNTELLHYLDIPENDLYTKQKEQADVHKVMSQLINSTPSLQSMKMYVKKPMSSDPKEYVSFVEHNEMFSEPWYALAEKSDFTWLGERSIETMQGTQNVVTFARKIYSNTLEYQGVLLLNVKAKVLYNMMVGEKQTAHRYLLDSGGRLIVGTNQSIFTELKLPELLNKTQSGTGYMHKKGNAGGADADYLIVWAKSFNEGWIISEVTPWEMIAAGSFKLAMTIFWIGLVSILAAVLFTLYLSRSFTKPIRQLLQAMGKFPLEQKQVDLPVDYNNEFGSMFNGYRRLTERIDELYRSLDLEHQRKRKAEIKALQAMINPHFLYNTLDQLNWMAIDAGHERMSHVLELMGRMFRIGLSNGESLITLEQELLHTECYLQIQQLRWGDGLLYTIDVADESMKALLIPKLILQPFVENAVIHGFHDKQQGRITITALQDEQGLIIRIADDGVGLKPGWNRQPRRNTGGYGIRNVRERIEAYFGSPYGITIEPGHEGQGTQVTLRIPRLEPNDSGGNDYVENRRH